MQNKKTNKRIAVTILGVFMVLILYVIVVFITDPPLANPWQSQIIKIDGLPGMIEIFNVYSEAVDIISSEIVSVRVDRVPITIDIHIINSPDSDVLDKLLKRLLEYFGSDEFVDWIENHEEFEFFYDIYRQEGRIAAVRLSFHIPVGDLRSYFVIICSDTREVRILWQT